MCDETKWNPTGTSSRDGQGGLEGSRGWEGELGPVRRGGEPEIDG